MARARVEPCSPCKEGRASKRDEPARRTNGACPPVPRGPSASAIDRAGGRGGLGVQRGQCHFGNVKWSGDGRWRRPCVLKEGEKSVCDTQIKTIKHWHVPRNEQTMREGRVLPFISRLPRVRTFYTRTSTASHTARRRRTPSLRQARSGTGRLAGLPARPLNTAPMPPASAWTGQPPLFLPLGVGERQVPIPPDAKILHR